MRGEIYLNHCRGQDCIMFIFFLMVFMIIIDDYYQKFFISDIKMGCFISRDEPKIKIFDLTPPGNDFDYLRPQGTTTFSIDRKCNVPLT